MKLNRTALISRIEIQQLLLEEYSREIFENVGQVLSLIRMQLLSFDPGETKNTEVFAASGQLVGKVIRDLRRLSRGVKPEDITENGFANTLIQELGELRQAGLCVADWKIEGEIFPLNPAADLSVYCMLYQWISPLLNSTLPGVIRLHIAYGKNDLRIWLDRKFQGEPLYLAAEECRRYKKRAVQIGGRFTYTPEASPQLFLSIKKTDGYYCTGR
jgi:hypothetical protein